MGYAFVTAYCYTCKKLINFHPHKVPSVRINDVREPVCRECIERANPTRIAKGLPPIEILPGAYEPCEEWEL